MKILLLAILGICFGCSSPQYIRKSNYYHHDWSAASTIVDSKKQKETFKKHPIFYEAEDFKGGKLKEEKTLHYFFFGIFPSSKTLNIDEICESEKFEQAYIDHDFGQAFISFFTLGIYTPRTARVWCHENS